MLAPHRFINFNYCLVYVTSLIIECLRYRGSSTLKDLYSYCKSYSKEINEQDVTLSVSFLYLLGKAKYNIDSDKVELV